MNPVSLTLDLILASLLLITLMFGLRLDKRLKTLQASQTEFAGAVAELDQAAARAESGLADLRGAMDEAVDLLAGRIDKARELAARLETLTAEGVQALQTARAHPPMQAAAPRAAAPAPRGAPAAQPSARRASALDRVWGRAGPAQLSSGQQSANAHAEAAAERLAVSLTRDESLDLRRPPQPAPRSRAIVDDDLFDRGVARRVAGARS